MSATTPPSTARMEETDVLIRLFTFEVARLDLIANAVGLPPDKLLECWIRAALRDAHGAGREVAP